MKDNINGVNKEIYGETIDLCGVPSLKLNNLYYNCTECSSTIEILSLNEQEIEFKCNNKHHVKTPISDYINKMKKYNTLKLNYNICNMHNKEYSSYCFDCNIHLCKDCIKSREHSYHYKIYLFEIIPTNKVLNDFENLINENKNFIINLNNEKIIKENKLKIILNNNINKINKKKYKEKGIIKIEENKRKKLCDENYASKIKKLKEEYKKEFKRIKIEYEQNINYIQNKFKNMNILNESYYNFKIDFLKTKYNIIKNKYSYKKEIEKKLIINELMEIVYNTYKIYNNNYYNITNLINIYNDYFKIDKNKAAKINKLDEYKDIIKEKDEIIKDKEIELKEKEELLKDKENKLKEKDIIINQKEYIIKCMDEKIKDKLKIEEKNQIEEVKEDKEEDHKEKKKIKKKKKKKRIAYEKLIYNVAKGLIDDKNQEDIRAPEIMEEKTENKKEEKELIDPKEKNEIIERIKLEKIIKIKGDEKSIKEIDKQKEYEKPEPLGQKPVEEEHKEEKKCKKKKKKKRIAYENIL